MNMPVYHTYSKGKYFIGFRCPHYVIEDVSWKREMKGKGMSTVASPRAASSSGGPPSISPSSAVSNNGSGSGSSPSTTGSSYSLMTVSEDGLESEYGDEADAEYEEGEEDEDEDDEYEDTDYAPSESTGFTGNRKVSDYVLRASKQ